jgi:hypothetical protein
MPQGEGKGQGKKEQLMVNTRQQAAICSTSQDALKTISAGTNKLLVLEIEAVIQGKRKLRSSSRLSCQPN